MEYVIHLAILCSIYAILGMSLNLVTGFTGLVSMAHAAFFGIGAYVTAILMMTYGVNFFVALVGGCLVTAIAALLIGVVLSRLSGDYYVLGTVGFNFIIFSLFLNWESVTRGALGIPGISRPEFFGISFFSNEAFFILSAVIALGVYFVSRFIVSSSFGRVLKAIREDEKAIQVFGYRTVRYKLLIFVVAAIGAASAGSFLASYITFIDPASFVLGESVLIVSMVILGGLANLKGSIMGALFLVILPEFLRFVGFPVEVAAQMRQVVYGLLLVTLMLYRPQGLMGEYTL